MSKTFRKTPPYNSYALWIYAQPKKQNYDIYNQHEISVDEDCKKFSYYNDDHIETKNYKRINKTRVEKHKNFDNFYKVQKIIKSFVNKKFVDFEQCLKNNGLYNEVHRYINFKSQTFNSFPEYYVNSHGFICKKQYNSRTVAPNLAIKTLSDGAILVSHLAKYNYHHRLSNKYFSHEKYMHENLIYFDLNNMRAYMKLDLELYVRFK